MTKAFDMIMQGLDEVGDYLGGAREGYEVHIPDEIDVKAIRAKLKLSQPEFASRFGFSVGRIRDWEQKRFPVDAPSRAFLTVIAREPGAVIRALSPQQQVVRRSDSTDTGMAKRRTSGEASAIRGRINRAKG